MILFSLKFMIKFMIYFRNLGEPKIIKKIIKNHKPFDFFMNHKKIIKFTIFFTIFFYDFFDFF